MARETTFQVQSRQVVSTLEEQHKYDLPTLRRLGVFAEPVNTEIKPAASGAAKLAAALAEAKPGLDKLLMGMAADEADKQDELGKAAALSSGDQSYDAAIEATSGQNPAFKAGYLKTRGFVAGEALQSKFNEAWESVDKSGKDANGKPTFKPNEWIGNWWKENTKGVDNQHFLSGLTKPMAQSYATANAAWGEQALKETIAERGYNFKQLLRGDLGADGFDMNHYNQRVEDFVNTNGGSPKELSTHTAELLKEASANGEVDVVEKLLKLKTGQSKDGVHVFGKAMAEDQHIMSTAASNHGIALAAKKKAVQAELLDKYETDLTDIMIKGLQSGDRDKAMESLTAMFKDHPEFGFKAIAEIRNVFDGTLKKEETRQMQGNFADAFVKVDTGKMGREGVQKAIAAGEISPNQGVTLLARIKANADQARAEGKQDKAEANRERQLLKQTLLGSAFNHLSKEDTEMLGKDTALAYRQELSLLQFSAVKEFDGVLGDTAKQMDLLTKYQQRSSDLLKRYTQTDAEKFSGFTPRYKSKAELLEATKRGDDPVAIQKHIDYFKWLSTQQNKGNK